ncbi:hypothetical protein JM84_2378 [Dokdonia sp. Hel_I_63]|uniref:hypothetical protein n=1 Tax=Dokdonia sp. Hel_I_63 TaxID=1249996 RepID=UPI00119C69E0|nr:hypothetical protein [Dokdonia sp. Hel_I_63]TVZ23453.1 hypothetical protein JM84_2378 [Dokdonia sp. Hel_I_63]
MFSIWETFEFKIYLIGSIYDVDEIVLKYGDCDYKNEKKIERYFSKYENRKPNEWKEISVTKEEYLESRHIEEEQYMSDLNYQDIDTEFCIMCLESEFLNNIIPDTKTIFLNRVSELIINSEFEGKSKVYLNEILDGLTDCIKNLIFITTKSYNKPNDIQIFVINSYLESYKKTISIIISKYKFIDPFLIENFLMKNSQLLEIDTISQENPHPLIFRSLEGFLIFEKLHNDYKKEKYHLANYSFLFYALERDGLLNSTQKSFRDFLATQNIFIDKIDARQAGRDNKKVNYYRTIYDSVLKAH